MTVALSIKERVQGPVDWVRDVLITKTRMQALVKYLLEAQLAAIILFIHRRSNNWDTSSSSTGEATLLLTTIWYQRIKQIKVNLRATIRTTIITMNCPCVSITTEIQRPANSLPNPTAIKTQPSTVPGTRSHQVGIPRQQHRPWATRVQLITVGLEVKRKCTVLTM